MVPGDADIPADIPAGRALVEQLTARVERMSREMESRRGEMEARSGRIRGALDQISVTLEALRAGDESHRSLIGYIAAGVVIQDASGAITDCNRAAERILGLSSDQIRERTSFDPRWRLVREDGHPIHGEEHPAMVALRTGEPVRGVVMGLHRPDGSLTWILVDADVPPVPAGRPPIVITTFLDISAHRLAESRLREGERRYRGLVENLNAGVVVHDRDGLVLLANPRACALLGIPEQEMIGGPAGKPGWRIIREDGTPLPPEENPVSRVLATGAPVINVVTGVLVPGSATPCWLLANATPIPDESGALAQVLVTFVDISRRKEAEQALLHSQEQLAIASRMAAMGTLVGGVAHEINNPLACTLSAQSAALQDLRALATSLDEETLPSCDAVARAIRSVAEAIEDAQAGAQRVSRIVKDLTAIGRPDPRRARIRLVDVVEHAVHMLSPPLAARADISVTGGDSLYVNASAGQLEEVFLNLFSNAAMAVPEGRDGRVEVTCSALPGRRAQVTVVDDGAGMDAETLARIFDPFFTTRPVGDRRGTGLGLAICHAVITAHGGEITVTSEPGRGSTFTVELPAL